jgi:hypothetical protein
MVDDMYKIGTRIKKVKGSNLGNTGVVVDHPQDEDCMTIEDCHEEGAFDYDMYVKEDQAWRDTEGNLWPSGSIAVTRSCDWEPIIPDGSNVPSEASIHELLDYKFYEQAESLHAPA